MLGGLCAKTIWLWGLSTQFLNLGILVWMSFFPKSKFGIHPMAMRKLVRKGKLKARLLKIRKAMSMDMCLLKKRIPG